MCEWAHWRIKILRTLSFSTWTGHISNRRIALVRLLLVLSCMRIGLLPLVLLGLPTTAYADEVNVRDHRLAVANTSQVDVRDHRTPSPPVSVALRAGYRSTTVQRRSPQRLSTTPFRLQVDGWARGPAHNANLGGVGIQIAAQIGYGYVGTEVAAADYANVSFAQAGGVVGLIVPLSARVSIGGELAAGARSGPLGDRYWRALSRTEFALS